MNTDILDGKWEQLKGQAKQQWGKLTNDDIDKAEGNVQELSGKIQERYGVTKDEADKQIEEWFEKH